MSIARESRTAAEMVVGSLVLFVPDGTEYGTDGNTKKASYENVPTVEEAKAVGKILGEVDSWKWNTEYKTHTRSGFSWKTQRFESRDKKTLTKVKPQFSTVDITPEAWALEFGLDKLPAMGEKAQPFSNASGTINGHLYLFVLDSLRTHGEDGIVANIHMRGELGLQDNTENNGELKKINYEFSVTSFPEDSFENIGLNPDLP